MVKAIRNTFFTLAALSLTAIGVHWNKEVVATKAPIAITASALADQVIQAENNDFPLELRLSRETVRLGQRQLISVTTRPWADLSIQLTRPDTEAVLYRGQANELGQYQISLHLDDFRQLGLFRVTARASLNELSAEGYGQFLLQTWAPEQVTETEYRYPLVP